jgi:hypothetical protein
MSIGKSSLLLLLTTLRQNLSTGNDPRARFGINVPSSLLVRADRVIE